MSKALLDSLLHAKNRSILDLLPEEPADALDRFILLFIEDLARKNLGSGFEAIQAAVKLEGIRQIDYQKMREIALASPDYADFTASKT